MATMNVSLPDEMKAWVEEQADSGQFANVSDYIRDVLRRERLATERLEAEIEAAKASGVVQMSPAELLADIKDGNRKIALATADEIRAERAHTDDAA